VQSAALRAVQQGEVEAKHFEEAFFECVGGLKENSIRTPEELKRIAIHESGHILATILTGTSVKHVTVVSHENFGGYAGWVEKHANYNLNTQNDFLVMAISLLGSYAAEKIVYGQTTGGTCADLLEVDNILNQMVKEFGMGSGELGGAIWSTDVSDEMKKKFDQDVCEKRQRCLKAVCTVLENHKADLEKLAQRLVEKLVLNEQEIYEIVGQPRNEVAALL
jgi:ATP-dependent Zn proteases